MDLLRIYIDEEQSVRVIVISVLKRQELLGDGKSQPVERSLHPAVREHCDCFVMGTQGQVTDGCFRWFADHVQKHLLIAQDSGSLGLIPADGTARIDQLAVVHTASAGKDLLCRQDPLHRRQPDHAASPDLIIPFSQKAQKDKDPSLMADQNRIFPSIFQKTEEFFSTSD